MGLIQTQRSISCCIGPAIPCGSVFGIGKGLKGGSYHTSGDGRSGQCGFERINDSAKVFGGAASNTNYNSYWPGETGRGRAKGEFGDGKEK